MDRSKGDNDMTIIPQTGAKNAEILQLSRNEQTFLTLVQRSPGRFYSRHELAIAIWGDDFHRDNNLNYIVATLRRKLGAAGRRLMTVHPHGGEGGGYMWLERDPVSTSRAWTVEVREQQRQRRAQRRPQ